MKNRSLYSVLTRFGIVAAVLTALLVIAPAATAQSASECALDGGTVKCTYEENGTDPVASFSATDDEGDAITWSLKEAGDYKKFAISESGVLTFMSPPDFDSPGDDGADNVYNVTVVAGGGVQVVEVTVTDLNEPGTVKFRGNQQPQVGEMMAAQLSDEDGQTVRLSWQWSKGPSMEGPWEDVGSTSSSYRAKEADIDSYLRATVSYTDVEYDEPDTVSGVTTFAVRARPAANAAPKFAAQSIEVFENTDGGIGTVTASDDDELVYSLWETGDPAVGTDTDGDDETDDADNDNGSFEITDSGELKLTAKLDYEQDDSDRVDSTTNDAATTDRVEYTVVVTATDPSGASGSGAVIVELLNVDEAPAVTVDSGATANAATVDENSQLAAPINFNAAADPEGKDVDQDNSEGAWTLEGADALKFMLDGEDLTFKGADGADGAFRPNFESPKDADGDNVYEVTVVVPVTESVKPGKRSVKVTVTDAEDTGTLKIAARQPQVGATVSGTLSDEDGGIRDRVWQWYRGGEVDSSVTDLVPGVGTDDTCSATNAATATESCVIDKATSPSYATTDADGGFFVHLVVSYTDAFDSDDDTDTATTDTATLEARPTRVVQSSPAVNAAPKFGIQDREIDGDEAAPEEVTRTVDEGTKAVGEFEATDTELLTFMLGGADGSLFGLSGPSGMENSVTLSLKAAPDFENPADADGDNAYEVEITAKDPSGATDTLMVTAMVEDVDDKPVISLAGNSMCELDGSTVKCTYEENGMDPVASLSVADDENDATTWSLKADDYKRFAISEDGVLEFKSPPDFDGPGDGDKDNVYKVTVVAEGGERADGERAVEVTVTDLDEPGKVTFTGNQQPQVGELTTAMLKDEDGNVVRLSWQWSKGPSMEGPWEDVSSTTASYRPKEADTDSYLRATVSYTDVEFDEPDTVSGVTKFAVRARPSANAAPKFSAQSIEVFENTDGSIGTVTASDDDELIYSMAMGDELDLDRDDDADTNDNGSFTISDSGELKLSAKLDYEQDDSDRVDSTTNDDATTDIVEYTAIVTATDPSGASGSGAVIIRLLNVDEAPAITAGGGATENAATVAEGAELTAISFSAGTDPEGGTVSANTAWELEGADALKFALTGDNLNFDEDFSPNFEKPADADKDNVYEVTVVVPVAESVQPGKRSVKVTVTDAEDTGTLKIAARQPQVGATVSGTLSDEDGGIRDRVWQWYRGGEVDSSVTDLVPGVGTDDTCSATNAATATESCVIDKAESSSYATTDADGGFFVHLVVSYTDAFDSDNDADTTDTATLEARPVREVQAAPTTNESPKFGIQDREIDGDEAAPESVTRTVDEGTKAVGEFEATDTELLTFMLGGADGSLFGLSGPSGMENSVTLSLKAAPDFENPSDADGDNAYEVSITAKDPSGATDTLMVTVMVEDVDDKPTISLVTEPEPEPENTAPAFAAETAERSVDENTAAGGAVGDPVTASDADEDTLAYTLGGADAASFAIDNMGQITVGEGTMLDFESETTSYSVTVTATDDDDASDSITVTIMVTDVDETPMFEREAAEFSVEENVPVGTVVGTETAIGVESYSDDSDYFDVDGMGNIKTAMMLDYESGTTSYMVTVTATGTDGSTDTIAVTVTVVDMHPDCPDMDNSLTNDCEALLDAKGDLGGDLNWDTDTAMADWEGVSMSDGRVSGIWLRDEGLDGSVSAALGRLSALTVLNLHSNMLSGPIPDLSGASMLEELYLANNADYVTNDDGKKVKVDGTGLTGEIPMWLNGMVNMTELWLWGNSLSGSVPDLSGMMSLDKLKLANNDLTGNINAMYLPENVSWLIIDRNGFSGSIPDLSGLASLKLLWLHTNELTGSVPSGGMLPASLDDLNLRDNMLMGSIPDLSALDNLTRLRLHNNSLSGAVPGSLGGLDSLKQLWLHNETDDDGMLIGNNMFTSIDDGVGGLSNTLMEIQLGGNPWADDACVPESLADVATNDYEAAGIAVCGADDGS